MKKERLHETALQETLCSEQDKRHTAHQIEALQVATERLDAKINEVRDKVLAEPKDMLSRLASEFDDFVRYANSTFLTKEAKKEINGAKSLLQKCAATRKAAQAKEDVAKKAAESNSTAAGA